MNPTCHQEEILIATHPSQRLYLKVIGTVGPKPRTKKKRQRVLLSFPAPNLEYDKNRVPTEHVLLEKQ